MSSGCKIKTLSDSNPFDLCIVLKHIPVLVSLENMLSIFSITLTGFSIPSDNASITFIFSLKITIELSSHAVDLSTLCDDMIFSIISSFSFINPIMTFSIVYGVT